MPDLDPILEQVQAGDPVGAAYRLEQLLGKDAPGGAFYEAGSLALSRREELGEEALRFARLAFAEAVERDPQNGEAHHDLATTMRELGMADDAAAQYKKALALLPGDVDCMIGLGAALCDAGRMDEGITTLKKAVDLHPASGPANANLGVALEAAGMDEEAAAAYARAVARFDAALLDAKDDEQMGELALKRRWARVQQAAMLERLERWPQAVVEYRRLLEEEEALAEAAAEGEGDEEDDDDEDETLDGDYPLDDGQGDRAADGAHEDEVDDETDALDDEDTGEHLDPDHDHAHDDDEYDEGRRGLERVFARLIGGRRFDLAYLVLDDLGGELADPRTRATYTIYDPGDGVSTIMVEHWDSGERERLDPVNGSPGRPRRSA